MSVEKSWLKKCQVQKRCRSFRVKLKTMSIFISNFENVHGGKIIFDGGSEHFDIGFKKAVLRSRQQRKKHIRI